ncbi:MAG: carbohydrate porin [Deltaproteobacteria bacterium]|nr:carbohydrate porin [Deltaproteobacteria bacterium]
MRAIAAVLSAAVFVFLFVPAASKAADEKGGKTKVYSNEMEDVKARITELENKMKDAEVTDDLGHRLHPIHSMYGLKFGGGVTMTGQGASHTKNAGVRGAGALSADITLETPVGKDGRVAGVLDFQHGAGLQGLPQFFASPNGNATGPNNDIESFNDDALHVAQFYYEHNLAESMVMSIGQLDPTAYFDANSFANSERAHFLANVFANNPAVEFGGTGNFYGPGMRLTLTPVKETLDLTVGAIEGDGDYVNTFDNPFYMAEADLKVKPNNRKGNYRAYYWNRHGRPDVTNTANPNDERLLRATNEGVGVSFDQWINGSVGVWLRGGRQRAKVAQFNAFAGGGIHLSGAAVGRRNDRAGLGYAVSLMGKDYKAYKKSVDPAFEDGDEQYMEAYYNYAVGDATDTTGFHVSPDYQFVVNPGGDTNASKAHIYGIRLQAFF